MTRIHWPAVGLAALSLVFLLAASGFADDEQPGKGKGKGDPGKKATMKGGKGKGASALQLPPGLARKPANHPGRMNWIKAHSGTKAATPKKGPPAATPTTKTKGGGDLERRLDRLLSEIEELRREIRKKK